MPNVKVNCLVRVNTNSKEDFTEWLQYHIALGFDCVFVFDTGNRSWLDPICEKYREHTVLVPRNEDWRYKKNIINTYNTRHFNTWAVCLDDDEFIWLDFNAVRSIKQVIDMQNSMVQAISIYVKYLSSEKPMRYRVGTKIDCFTHARQDPQGFNFPNAATPNAAITMFYSATPNVEPMQTPMVPTTRFWCDILGNELNAQRLNGYLGGRAYDPSSFPVRCYKYGLKSGEEMEFKPGTCPVGYVVSDPSMQRAREILLHVPMNMTTESIFAKNEPVPAPEEIKEHTPTAEEIAESSLPITAGKIDALILRGKFFEDVVDSLNNTEFDKKALERVFDRERIKIIEGSPVYRQAYDLLNSGKTNEEVATLIKVGKFAFERMLKCLDVLDIASYDTELESKKANIVASEIAVAVSTVNDHSDEAENEMMDAEAKKLVENKDMASLTAAFDSEVSANKMTESELKAMDMIDADKKKRNNEANKKSRAKKKLESKKANDTISEVANAETAESVKSATDDPPKESDEANTNLIDSVDLSAFGIGK